MHVQSSSCGLVGSINRYREAGDTVKNELMKYVPNPKTQSVNCYRKASSPTDPTNINVEVRNYEIPFVWLPHPVSWTCF